METSAIVGWDGTVPATRAAEWLADRQARNGRALSLVRIVDPDDVQESATTTPRFAAAASETEAEAERLRLAHRGLEVFVRVLKGEPFNVLRELSSPSNLVAVGRGDAPEAGGRGPSLAERLASTAPGPIAVVPDEMEASRRGIVVGVDGTEASLQALGFAAQEASDLGEPLEVVHAWLHPPGGPQDALPDRFSTDLLRHRHESLLEESLVEVLAHHPMLAIRRRVVQGLPLKVLLQEAREARMLIVGNHGRRHVARFLLGSVSNALIRGTGGATVVVKTAEGASTDASPKGSVFSKSGAVHGSLSPSLHS